MDMFHLIVRIIEPLLSTIGKITWLIIVRPVNYYTLPAGTCTLQSH